MLQQISRRQRCSAPSSSLRGVLLDRDGLKLDNDSFPFDEASSSRSRSQQTRLQHAALDFSPRRPPLGCSISRGFASTTTSMTYTQDRHERSAGTSSTASDNQAEDASRSGDEPPRATELPALDPRLPYDYRGPWGATATRVKRLSLFSAVFTFLTGPLLVFPPEALMVNHAPFAWKVAILGTMYGFTCFTTALLHWYVKPYVHQLQYDPGTGNVRALVADFWTRKHWQEFHVSEAQWSDSLHPYAQFKARGRYYQLERDHVLHPDLIQQLVDIPRPVEEGRRGNR